MDIITSIWQVYQAIAVVFTTFFLFGLVKNLRNKPSAEDIKKAMDTIKLVHIETVNNTAMMYDSVNKTFLCQAPTTEELWAVAKTRWPAHKFIEVDLDKLEK